MAVPALIVGFLFLAAGHFHLTTRTLKQIDEDPMGEFVAWSVVLEGGVYSLIGVACLMAAWI